MPLFLGFELLQEDDKDLQQNIPLGLLNFVIFMVTGTSVLIACHGQR